jgi:hypothetical protein
MVLAGPYQQPCRRPAVAWLETPTTGPNPAVTAANQKQSVKDHCHSAIREWQQVMERYTAHCDAAGASARRDCP